ncbi:hypothetical protein [Streptomyces sp. NPDC059802]
MSVGDDFMYVRVARLEPHSYLWEHRDYAELRDSAGIACTSRSSPILRRF